MPYIPRQASIINKADACSAGMKKSGLAPTSDFVRVNRNYLKTRSMSSMPTFTLQCLCGTRGKIYGTRIVHGRPVPIG